ncbi:MAG TPA: glycogen debranching enzyme N-terminal domain-containing protein, partial [Candidatus Limnocylindrales bacterium]|nr:glycogen debranching enzyme N-terminal domain-containing protein [Candidatus Limnocylindrales bacterium]
MADAEPAQVRFGRGLCGDLAAAEGREWLLTNGRGGYAMGTVAGTLTRRYHGLLIAAADPPVTRRLIVARLDLDADYDGRAYALATNRWRSGAIAPEGWRLAEAFAVADGLPTWTYALGDALLEVTLAMPRGADATAVLLRAARARGPLGVRGRLVVADRDHHGGPLPDPGGFTSEPAGGGLAIALPASAATLHVAAPGALRIETARERYEGYLLPRETERGLQDVDDYLHACTITWQLSMGDEQGVVVSFETRPDHGAAGVVSADAREIVRARREANRALAEAQATPLLGRLALAADAFIVARRTANGTATPATPATPDAEGTTIIAGYPWFTDWGRDTMIALPGLLLATGRTGEAAAV